MDFQQTNILSMTGNSDFATTSQLANYVDLTSAQTISGVKTFSALPVSSVVPTTTTQLVNKSYVDGLGVNYVDLTSTQTITGAKTFNANVRLNNTRNLIFGTTTGGIINFTTGGMYYDNQASGSHFFFVGGTPIADIDTTGLVIRTSKKLNFYNGSWIYEDGAGSHLDYNTPTGYYHSLRINNVEQLRLDTTRLTLTGDMRLSAGKKVEFDATGSHYITEGTSTLNSYVPTGSTHKWFINSVEQLSLDAGLGATFAGEIRMKFPYSFYPDDTITGGRMVGSGAGGFRFDAEIGADYKFFVDSSVILTINSAGISIPTASNLELGVAGSNISYQGTSIRYNIPTGKFHDFRVNTATILNVVAGGVSVVGGYLGRQGTTGAFAPTYNNAYYTGAVLQAWNNAVNLGNFTICDYRIKENIKPAGDVLDRLCKVEMIEYNQKDISIFKNVGNQFGFIAHQVKELFPELPNIVAGEKDALTSEGGIQPQTINSEFTNLYLKAIQELNAKIEAQQAQIDGLLVAMAKLVSQQIV